MQYVLLCDAVVLFSSSSIQTPNTKRGTSAIPDARYCTYGDDPAVGGRGSSPNIVENLMEPLLSIPCKFEEEARMKEEGEKPP
jgi:hypothetical protein